MRLLLVEDDEQLARRLSDRLRGAGFAVDLARNRAEGEDWPDMEIGRAHV
jgi:two-component system OmpR family response regulator